MTEIRHDSTSSARNAENTSPLQAASAPHLCIPLSSTRRIMWDVVLGLFPVLLAAIWYFRIQAAGHLITAVCTCLLTERLFCWVRRQPNTLRDGSVLITGLILALSLPPQLSWFATALGSVVAVALGKVVFGGLGSNIFNPAMVGRAFLMACFPAAMTTWSPPATFEWTVAERTGTWPQGESDAGDSMTAPPADDTWSQSPSATVDGLSGATPLAAAKYEQRRTELWRLSWGEIPGSTGETCSWAILMGGAWLLFRRAADWRLTAGMLLSVVTIAAGEAIFRSLPMTAEIARHLTSGAMMLGAFFIVTDPVTSPLTKSGRWSFGLIVGALTMTIRLFSGYPEGVMYAVLLGNSLTPLINHWTRPTPVGGAVRWTSLR